MNLRRCTSTVVDRLITIAISNQYKMGNIVYMWQYVYEKVSFVVYKSRGRLSTHVNTHIIIQLYSGTERLTVAPIIDIP